MSSDQTAAQQDQDKLQGPDDLAIDAVSEATKKITEQEEDKDLTLEDEVEQSDEFAETLHSLENLIESKANKVMRIKQEMKKKRQMVKDVYANDAELTETEEKKEEVYQAWRERKAKLKESPEVKQLKRELKDMRNERKDVEESLSNHLINYHQMTNSTSFDTSDGDQWEFKIKAKVKNKKV